MGEREEGYREGRRDGDHAGSLLAAFAIIVGLVAFVAWMFSSKERFIAGCAIIGIVALIGYLAPDKDAAHAVQPVVADSMKYTPQPVRTFEPGQTAGSCVTTGALTECASASIGSSRPYRP